ncbi:MAG: hypothetical protein KBD12_02170 [Candidatus Pacebacteria bacterium]|nr:hypothetical protein [Candidatus Paceibacterota bacterium]
MQTERDEYITDTLEKLSELVKENNELLKKLEKYQKINSIFKIVYWVFILLSVFGAYYFLQPFVNSLFGENNTTFNNISNQMQNMSDVSAVKDILNKFGN